jgi:hypothetical protein
VTCIFGYGSLVWKPPCDDGLVSKKYIVSHRMECPPPPPPHTNHTHCSPDLSWTVALPTPHHTGRPTSKAGTAGSGKPAWTIADRQHIPVECAPFYPTHILTLQPAVLVQQHLQE